LPCASLRPYDSQVRFTCSRCGKRYASTDEPVSGRIYAIGCKCGHTIVVKGPEVSGVRNGTHAAGVREDPFSAFHKQREQRPIPAQFSKRPTPVEARRASQPSESQPDPEAESFWAWRSEPPSLPAAPDFVSPDAPAAGNGQLLDVDRARALSSGSMATEVAPLPPPQDEDEVSITFSERLPLSRRGARRPWLLAAAGALALLVVVGGALAVLSRRPRAGPEPEGPAPAPAVAAPLPAAPAAPTLAAPPAPAPGPEPRPAAVVAPRPGQRGDAALRAPATSRPPRPTRRASPAVVSEPAPAPAANAVSPTLLDLMSRKADAPAAPPKPETRGGASPGLPEVQAAVERDRSAFDACVADPGSDQPAGREVVLVLTVNPSGIVTSPHLDDEDLEGSPAGACLRAAARKLVLPSFAGEPVRLRVPLNLGP